MLSEEVLSSDELETLRRSRNPTTVTANEEVQTNMEAQVDVHDLDLFVTAHMLDDTLAVLSLGKLLEEHGYTYVWASGPKPHLTKQGKKVLCKTENCVPLVVPELSSNYGTSLSSILLPQNSSSTSTSPATERSDGPAPGNWRDSPKNSKRKNKKEGEQSRHGRPTVCETFRNGWSCSQKISKIQKCLHCHTFLMTQIRNVLQEWHPESTVFILTSKRSKLRRMLAIQDDKGSLQRTHSRRKLFFVQYLCRFRDISRRFRHTNLNVFSFFFQVFAGVRDILEAAQNFKISIFKQRKKKCANFSSQNKICVDVFCWEVGSFSGRTLPRGWSF